VTGPGDVLFGRAEIERAFTALGERLARRGVVADVFVVGGAAMALAYDAARVTRDVDAVFMPHGIVLEEARKVADDLGLPNWWLNEQASVYISGKEDVSKRRVFDHTGIARNGGLSSSCLRNEGTRRRGHEILMTFVC
jgi:hypothetical protein